MSFLQNLCHVDGLDQEPLSKISHNERPDTVAFEVEAALEECLLRIFSSTVANFNTGFTHPDIVKEITSLYGIMVPSKSWV